MMNRTFTVNGKEVEFAEITVVFEGETMNGLLIHDVDDEYSNGDCITTEYDMPEDNEDAENIIENACFLCCFTYENEKYIVK